MWGYWGDRLTFGAAPGRCTGGGARSRRTAADSDTPLASSSLSLISFRPTEKKARSREISPHFRRFSDRAMDRCVCGYVVAVSATILWSFPFSLVVCVWRKCMGGAREAVSLLLSLSPLCSRCRWWLSGVVGAVVCFWAGRASIGKGVSFRRGARLDKALVVVPQPVLLVEEGRRRGRGSVCILLVPCCAVL